MEIGKSKSNSRLIKVILTIMMALLLVMTSATTVSANEENAGNHSFYKVSSAAAAYYDAAHNRDEDNTDNLIDGDENEHFKNVTMNDAGGFVGYYDRDLIDVIFGQATLSDISMSAQARGYGSYRYDNYTSYLRYGHALRELGLDSTSMEGMPFSSIGRKFTGGLMYGLYTLAVAIDQLFTAVIRILKTLNPFTLFVGTDVWLKNLMGNTGPIPEALEGLQEIATDMYVKVSALSWFIIPLFFVTMAASILLFRGSNTAQSDAPLTKIRKYATRVAFIVMGVPLLGILYTSSLNMLDDHLGMNSTGLSANHVISSTFVDFESWASNGHLALPNHTQIVISTKNSPSGNVDINNTTNVRELTRLINSYSGSGVRGSGGSDSDTGTAEEWNKKVVRDSAPTVRKESYTRTAAMIQKYMDGAFYHSSDFETEVKGGFKDADAPELYAAIAQASDIENWRDSKASIGTKQDENRSFIMTDGSKSRLEATITDEDTIIYEGKMPWTSSVWSTKRKRDITGSYGLSTMSIYNYLNTAFDNSSVITYSSQKATSGSVRQSHRSVNLVGTGITSTLYYLHAVSMLGAMAVLGIAYALGMIMSNLRRTIRMLTSLPIAMLGNLRAMAKITSIVGMMIVEVVGTLFTYAIILEVFRVLGVMVEVPIAKIFEGVEIFGSITLPGSAGLAASSIGTGASVITLLIGIILNVWFTISALKLRKSIIKSIDEWVAGWIDRLFVTSGGPGGGAAQQAVSAEHPEPKGPGMLKRLADGAAAGAGMAAVNNFMNRDAKADEDGEFKGSAGEGDSTTETGDPTKGSTSGAEGFEHQGLPSPGEDGEVKYDENGNPITPSGGDLAYSGTTSTGDDTKGVNAIVPYKGSYDEYGKKVMANHPDTLADKDTKSTDGKIIKGISPQEMAEGDYVDEHGNVVSKDGAIKGVAVDRTGEEITEEEVMEQSSDTKGLAVASTASKTLDKSDVKSVQPGAVGVDGQKVARKVDSSQAQSGSSEIIRRDAEGNEIRQDAHGKDYAVTSEGVKKPVASTVQTVDSEGKTISKDANGNEVRTDSQGRQYAVTPDGVKKPVASSTYTDSQGNIVSKDVNGNEIRQDAKGNDYAITPEGKRMPVATSAVVTQDGRRIVQDTSGRTITQDAVGNEIRQDAQGRQYAVTPEGQRTTVASPVDSTQPIQTGGQRVTRPSTQPVVGGQRVVQQGNQPVANVGRKTVQDASGRTIIQDSVGNEIRQDAQGREYAVTPTGERIQVVEKSQSVTGRGQPVSTPTSGQVDTTPQTPGAQDTVTNRTVTRRRRVTNTGQRPASTIDEVITETQGQQSTPSSDRIVTNRQTGSTGGARRAVRDTGGINTPSTPTTSPQADVQDQGQGRQVNQGPVVGGGTTPQTFRGSTPRNEPTVQQSNQPQQGRPTVRDTGNTGGNIQGQAPRQERPLINQGQVNRQASVTDSPVSQTVGPVEKSGRNVEGVRRRTTQRSPENVTRGNRTGDQTVRAKGLNRGDSAKGTTGEQGGRFVGQPSDREVNQSRLNREGSSEDK